MNAALRSFEAQWRARAADSLQPLREAAMARFMKLGLPTQRDETWRYTDLRSLAAQSFVDAACETPGEIEPDAWPSLVDAEQEAATLILVNGRPILGSHPPRLNGFEINSIRELSSVDSKFAKRFFEPASDADQRRMLLLNTALFTDGLYLKITARTSTPLVLLHVSTGRKAHESAHPRVIIDASPDSRATIIEHHVAQGDLLPLSNSNTHIALARGAQLEHYRVFATGAGATHLDSLDVHQAQDSHCKQFTIALGGGLVRASLEARLNQTGASLESYSLLVGHENRHVDCVNIVTHGAPHTRSRQTARAIASDSSRVVFNSKVIVNEGAIHSDSQQSCRGLLLSPAAEIDTRPQLEIHADEVKCAHGATTGRLDPDMLFYLVSRGLDRETAQSLLVYAFLADVLTGMSVSSARSAIESALINQLPDSQTLRKFR
ncbi:MAG TPA: Fe-S cluster assembly protein SufD [Steroidobacteraceae bacterium]|jgi:Fe-S cluster assembly protein SufD